MKILIPLFLIIVQGLFAYEVPREIQAQSVYIFDINSLEPVLERNSDVVLYPASLTKLLTAYILSQKLTPQDDLFYSSLAKNTEPYKLDLQVGEKVSAIQAMDALLVWSANDIATMIAENLGGNLYGFSELMNQEAVEMGMEKSHFVTPHGLHDPSHYTKAYDMSLLLKKVYDDPWTRETMEKHSVVYYENNGASRILKNRNKLIENPDCLGGKTGWTEEAGRCLAAVFKHNEKVWGGVIMNTIYDYPQDTVVFREMSALINLVNQMKPTRLYQKNDVVKELIVKFNLLNVIGPSLDTKIKVRIDSNVDIRNSDLPFNRSLTMGEIDPWALNKEKSIGLYRIDYRNFKNEYLVYSNVSTLDIVRSYWYIYLLIFGILMAFIIMSIAIFRLVRK